MLAGRGEMSDGLRSTVWNTDTAATTWQTQRPVRQRMQKKRLCDNLERSSVGDRLALTLGTLRGEGAIPPGSFNCYCTSHLPSASCNRLCHGHNQPTRLLLQSISPPSLNPRLPLVPPVSPPPHRPHVASWPPPPASPHTHVASRPGPSTFPPSPPRQPHSEGPQYSLSCLFPTHPPNSEPHL